MSFQQDMDEFDIYDPCGSSQSGNNAAFLDWQVVGRRLRSWTRSRFPARNEGRSNNDIPSPEKLPQKYAGFFHCELAARPESVQGTKVSFLNLPGELRNDIYCFLIYPHHNMLLVVFQTSPRDIFRSLLRSPIFRVNRQIRAEAFSFLCGTKKFRIINAPCAETFLRYIGPVGRMNLANITLMLSVFVDLNLGQAEGFFRFLREANHLRHFHLEIDMYITDQKHDNAKWDFLQRIESALHNIEGLSLTWSMILRLVPDDDINRLGDMFVRMEEIFGKENRRGGRAWEADGTEIKT
ncbi:uncharacterized protein BDR25DRAFT_347172 [Lindgomyces ingoldianus]|uniref:Uncharacterized protein n=1 Tax=Lindgomyces ingoldianus TaxID=673940 RepID=A0ACB6QBK3_9PLEO|nr:uncharacterized protein BDR25DRAFT_347172 [Lindgomyces ingoldianus]KAF2463536.1 hypothetical protein BDR25DRAFT_347172 [Lindgomyces ingoldianus]